MLKKHSCFSRKQPDSNLVCELFELYSLLRVWDCQCGIDVLKYPRYLNPKWLPRVRQLRLGLRFEWWGPRIVSWTSNENNGGHQWNLISKIYNIVSTRAFCPCWSFSWPAATYFEPVSNFSVFCHLIFKKWIFISCHFFSYRTVIFVCSYSADFVVKKSCIELW